jgi:glycosyltransferase involved in cell wall biosynthesis
LKKVLIVQAEMKHYRIPLFKQLHAALACDGVQLTVAYSNTNAAHASRKDRVDLDSPIGLRVSGKWFLKKFLYQPLWKQIVAADLVIIGPEVKYLLNPPLLVLSALHLKKVAFWGLGPNRHPDRSRVAEWIKQHFFTSVDWWFAYTQSVAEYLHSKGMRADRITNVQNTTDTAALINYISEIREDQAQSAKTQLTGCANASIGLYCGFLGRIKEIPMLIAAAHQVKAACPEFHLVIIGNGPERQWLENEIRGVTWIHYLGSLYDRESALYYKISDVTLLAGTAGLAIVDSFAAGLPVIATQLTTHPPEISYVQDGKNGRIAPHETSAYAAAIVEVLGNSALREKLSEGARSSGNRYTLDVMTQNFRGGIHKCLGRDIPTTSSNLEYAN